MKAIADTLLFLVALPIFLVLLLALGGLLIGAAVIGGLKMTAREVCSRRVWQCAWCGHYFLVDHRPRHWRPVGHFEGHGCCRACARLILPPEELTRI